MKKVLSVLLAVALCFSVFSVAVFAEGEDIQLKLNAPATAKMGDTITVTVSFESNKGYAGLKYDLGFDSTQLSLLTAKFEGDFAVDGSAAGMLGMFSDDKTRASSLVLHADKSDAGETTKTGTLATYTFKVLANGTQEAATNVNITLTVKDAFDKDLNNRSVNAPTATVAVQYTEKLPKVGDLDNSGSVDIKDVKYLLNHTLFPSRFPLTVQNDQVDYDGNGTVDIKDVKYLLNHTLFPSRFPLE